MKRYKKYITPYLGAFLMGPLMMLTEVAGEVALPKLMSLIINNGVAGKRYGIYFKNGTSDGRQWWYVWQWEASWAPILRQRRP